ncbi:tol-pal system protein YbgF [Vibrio nigripulchritudo ATCC 27043]|uniref:tol-pal system protein YbgF n=1 Tax=Vibrio TaxID=662 RepID=UPI00021C3AB9|nr:MULTISPECIES: tol-pal system protein YbgF [Vibrio]EGU61374.1 tol-pal system protein YbgF [Vibrio nigripulchritudo ATCC 27043]UAB69244.1 tol-pal system protein YbgF [Vibrio sp. SCSIO 43132]
MFSNSKRIISLTLLASAANVAFAAPAPVTDLNSTTVSTTTASTSARPSSANETEVQRLERLLQNRAKIQIQMQGQIDELSAEVGELRGIVERNSYEMNQMLQRQRELFVELDSMRQQLQQAPVVAASTDSGNDSTGTFSTNKDEQTAYQDAVDLILKQRDYAGAITAFKQFQVDFPDSKFAPNTHYWLGQLYFAKKQDVDAAKSFASVVAYNESNKRADALLKLGDIAKRNKKPDAAVKYYQQVISEYPQSASADMAKKQMQ